MGGGVSSISHTSEAFTNLEVELQKPSDGSDIKTPRGVTAQDEVVRLRKLLADLAVEGELLQRVQALHVVPHGLRGAAWAAARARKIACAGSGL